MSKRLSADKSTWVICTGCGHTPDECRNAHAVRAVPLLRTALATLREALLDIRDMRCVSRREIEAGDEFEWAQDKACDALAEVGDD